MIIHVTAGLASIERDMETLRKITSFVHKSGNVLAKDWIEPQYHISVNKEARGINPKQIYKINIDAIERSDMVIAEVSEKSFGTGFQIATALQKKKPTLLLIKNDRLENESAIARGMSDSLVVRKEYDDDTELERAVLSFMKDNTVSTKDLRFNFVIDRQINNHLRWRAYKSGKTKAEVVRDLLLRDMNDEDIV